MERPQKSKRPFLPQGLGQGGGVYNWEGTVIFQGCNIYDNTASTAVSAHALRSPFRLRSIPPISQLPPLLSSRIYSG